MGKRRLCKTERFHTSGTPESKRLKVTALNLWETSRLSFDRLLPGKPPTRAPLPFSGKLVFYIAIQLSERLCRNRENGQDHHAELSASNRIKYL